ncbi:Protein CWC15-like A, partial [Fragariocoptes setiger]
MTTAARPTFDPAKGGTQRGETPLTALSQQSSSRDLPGHLTLKERKPGQASNEEIKQKDLKAELEHRERVASIEKEKGRPSYIPSIEYATQIRLVLKAEKLRAKEENDDSLNQRPHSTSSDKNPDPQNVTYEPPTPDLSAFAQMDADEDMHGGNIDEGDQSDDDDEETAELMAELEKIRRERAAENERREAELRAKDERVRMKTILEGNPLINESVKEGSFKIKRRWDDDVVFKNCARGEPVKKQYVNDMLRLEFHKKFMDKYIQ